MEKTIPIGNFPYHADAAVLIGRLEAEDIRCFLNNEHLVNANPLLSNAVGGIDVSVRESDYERAMLIVKEMESNKKTSLQTENGFEGYTKVTVFCPNCDSSNCYRKKRSFFSFGPVEHICRDCIHRWSE
jgi:hypothetical protein